MCAHHFEKIGHLGIDRKLLPGFEDLLVLGGVRLLVKWVHVPILCFSQYFFFKRAR